TGDRRRNSFFAALLVGKTLENFNIVFDPRASEQLLAGKVNGSSPTPTFEIWASYTPKSLVDKPSVPDFHADQYRISAQIDSKLHMRVETVFTVNGLTRDLNALSFDLSRRMRVISAEVDARPAEISESTDGLVNAQSEALDPGDRLFVIVPGEPLKSGTEHTVKVVHEGDVITAGPNHVFFVGSRGRWYPRCNQEFARFDLKFRFPKSL